MPNDEKRKRAHFIIDTGHGFAAAKRQVRGILRALAGTKNKI
jgi:dephospho-CoA kinase